MKKHLIKTKLIERKTVRGLLVFLADIQYLPDTIDSEKHRTDTLCYMGFYDQIEKDIQNINDIHEVIKMHITGWHADFDKKIEELRETENNPSIGYMVRMIENFIKTTILSRCD